MGDNCLAKNTYTCDLNYGENPSDFTTVHIQLFKRGFHFSNLIDSKEPYFVKVSHNKGIFEQQYGSEEEANIAYSNICFRWHAFSIRYPGYKAINPYDKRPWLFEKDAVPYGYFKPIVRNDFELYKNIGNYNVKNNSFNFAFSGFTRSDSEILQIIQRYIGKIIHPDELENLIWIFTERTAILYKLIDSKKYIHGKYKNFKDYSRNNLEPLINHPQPYEALRELYQILSNYEFGQYDLGFNWYYK